MGHRVVSVHPNPQLRLQPHQNLHRTLIKGLAVSRRTAETPPTGMQTMKKICGQHHKVSILNPLSFASDIKR